MPALKPGSLQEGSAIPLYYQIKEILRQRIDEGGYKTGDILPSEAELQKLFKVSRATIRHAVDSLANEGLLSRKRGKGTFVAEPKIGEALPRLVSFTEEMSAIGRSPSTRRITVSAAVPPKRVADTLALAPGEKAIRLERVRCADGQPIVLLTSYLPESLGVSPDEDFSGSLYELLENKHGIELGKADQVIEASAADAYESEQLGIEKGAPVLRLKRSLCSKTGSPVEYVEGTYRADRYKYIIQLERLRR